MRGRAVCAGAIAAAGLVAATAPAVAAPSGDSCTASGSGTSYALTIAVPSTAPQQGGFAVGVGGTTIQDMTIQGDSGSLSRQNLPPGTQLAELPPSPLPPGQLTVNVETVAAVSGSFTVVPAAAGSASSPTWFDAVQCTAQTTPGAPGSTPKPPSNAFTVHAASWVAASHAWRIAVTTAGPGKVSYAVVGRQVLHQGTVGVGSVHTVRLMLRPTSLARGSTLRVTLRITFHPHDGKPATKLAHLALRRA